MITADEPIIAVKEAEHMAEETGSAVAVCGMVTGGYSVMPYMEAMEQKAHILEVVRHDGVLQRN